MSGTTSMRVGDRGRIVLPAELRTRRNWSAGTVLVALETDSGVVLARRDELEALVRKQLGGSDLVQELIGERRLAATSEDEA